MTSPFLAHGSAQIEVSQATITVHMRGHWNIEMRNQTDAELRQHIARLDALGPWGIINHLHDTLVYSEEIFTNSRQAYMARPPTSRLAGVAFVIEPKVEGAGLLRGRFESLLDGVIASKVFSDGVSALAWMNLQVQPPPPLPA